ncbi:MAG: esterase [Armatimonadetes bacterium]|nr:esterase [Armatimonadota bacterium]
MTRLIGFPCGIGVVLAAVAQAQPPSPEQIIGNRDANGDGKLSREEFPPQGQQLFDRIDTNKDGFVTLEEARAFAQQQRPPGPPPLPTPDYENVAYGPFERNVLDIWLAKSDKPTPLVIYYHGGGFRGGDKRTIQPQLLDGLLKAGVTVAAANYRLTDTAPYPAQMHDCARALQFLRLHAAEYNLDPTRVGATGGSAGAGISQWLAFHDDLADPGNEDEVLRQSTRITCAVVYAAQSSYDPRFHRELFGSDQVEPALIALFGMSGPQDVDDPKFWPLFEDASALPHLTADDAPVFAYYQQANDPLPPNAPGSLFIHHPKFGEVLKEKMDELGIECIVRFREDYPNTPGRAPVEEYLQFFLDKLGVTPANPAP